MNVYLNLTKANYEGESDLLTVEVPSSYTDELLRVIRPIAESTGSSTEKMLKDIIRESILEIERRGYERKSRKNAKR